MSDPIEIRPEDIIKRPAILPLKAGGTKEPGMLEQARSWMKQIKEFKELADEMGMGNQLGGILGNLGIKLGGGNQKAEISVEKQAANTGQQVTRFLKLLQIRYGDITVNEALECLRRDFGPVKLSEFTKGDFQ